MEWQSVTAIYLIGDQYPAATFADEKEAEAWGEQHYPGEWIKKPVKIPHLPLASKAAKKNLKNVAAMLDKLDWEDEGIKEPTPTKKIVVLPEDS